MQIWYNTHSSLTLYSTSGVIAMKVSYKKLWVLCAEQEISQAELRKQAGLASATFTKLRKNQEVNLSVLLRIAEILNCNAGDMMDFLPDDQLLREVDVDEVW